MIVDCFLFFQELDLLEIRLKYLYDVVDQFIILESTESFTGKEKPLIYKKNSKRFEKYIDKINYFVINDKHLTFSSIQNFLKEKDEKVYLSILKILNNHSHYDKSKKNYFLDTYHRECLHVPLSKICSNKDIVLISDIDEIPNKFALKELKRKEYLKGIMVFSQNEFKYKLNSLSSRNWLGTLVGKYELIRGKSLNLFRKNSTNFKKINPGGYHFTSIGTEEEIINKIENWTHQEYNLKIIKRNVLHNLLRGRDIFYRFGEKRNKIINLENDFYYDAVMKDILKSYKKYIIFSFNKDSFFDSIKYYLILFYIYILRFFKDPIKGIKKLIR